MAAVSLVSRSFAAESYLVADYETGQVLATKNENEQRPVASLTKIAAVLVALDWVREFGGDTLVGVPVSGEAITGGANPLQLQPGDALPLESALYAAMMASDNTSALALATELGKRMDGASSGPGDSDPVGVFVGRMNLLAEKLGMKRTLFVNPHGLDGEGEKGYSTAADMARLVIHAYDDPDFPKFSAEKEWTVDVIRNGSAIQVTLINTNELVGSRGIDGTKTGTTWRAGPCLVASATKELTVEGNSRTRRLVSVVLKSDDRFRDTVLLLDRAWRDCEAWLAEGGGIGTNDRLRSGRN